MSVLIDAGNCDPENLEVAASYRRVREAVFAFQPQQQELPDGEEEEDDDGVPSQMFVRAIDDWIGADKDRDLDLVDGSIVRLAPPQEQRE